MTGSIYSSQPPLPPPSLRRKGLGDSLATQTGIEIGTTAAEAGITSAVSGASFLGALGGPVGLAITGAMIGVTTLISHWKKAAQRRNIATAIVNEVAPYLQQNLEAFLSYPTVSNQQQAIQNFYILWDEVLNQCGKEELGQAGRRCISDREEGSTAFSWGNWFTLYLDPIRYYQGVLPDPTEADILTSSLAGSLGLDETIGGFPTMLIVGVALLGVGLLSLEKG